MAQIEIIADILQRSVEATKTLLLIPVWLVYVVSQMLILIVAMREVPNPPTPPRLSPRSGSFDEDVILEVLRYFVSFLPDGALALVTFQMEIVTAIPQIVVGATEILLLISVWSVYIVSQVLILFVAMKEVPPQPPPPPPAPLPFEKFNGDIILEIFRCYVASQPDGAFILTLVLTLWRDFVLRSPVLWQWITIDEQLPDWIEKAYLCATLSGACPLQIVLRLPMTEWYQLIPLLSRCQNLFFETPDYMTGRDVDQGTEKLLSVFKTPHNCTFHYRRAGEFLLHETREQLSTDLSDVLKLELDADGSEYPNYHTYARTRQVRYFELGDAYLPLVLLKLYRLLEILRNASNLRTLILSHHSVDPMFSEFDLPVVNLMNLDNLQITGIDYDRNGSLVPLLQSIRCPNLSTVSLWGEYEDVIDVMEHLGRISNPSNLELRYDGHIRRPLVAPISFQLPSVTHLFVQVNHETARRFIPEMGRRVNAAIRIASNATVLHFVIVCHKPDPAERDKFIKCVRHNHSSKGKCYLTCEQDVMLELAGMAVTEIDIKVFIRPSYFYYQRPRIVARISSLVLTMLACTPVVLLPILSQYPLPMLDTIQLHFPAEARRREGAPAELRHFDTNITRWITRHVQGHLPLRVHTFGLSWFPNWRTLLRRIYRMSKSLSDGRDLMIKLPAHPHPIIQKALLLALEGTDDGSTSISSVLLDGAVSSGVKG